MLVFFIYLTNICKLKFLAWSQQQILVVQITSVINYKASAWKGLFCQNLAKILKDLTEKDFSVHILFKSIVAQGLLWCNCRDFKKLIKKYQKFFVTLWQLNDELLVWEIDFLYFVHMFVHRNRSSDVNIFFCSLELIIFISITDPKCCSDDPFGWWLW